MAGLLMHAVVYVVVNALLVFAWLMTTGSRAELDAYIETPADALTPTFWPVYFIVLWGAVLIIHAAAVIIGLLPGSRRRREARKRRHRRKRYERERAARRATRKTEKEAAARTRAAEAETRAAEAQREAAAVAGMAPGADDRHDGVEPPHREWVVVMFTDISRSTPLTETIGDVAWADVLATHREAVRRRVGRHSGSEVGTQGDGFLVRFAAPEDAVECAVHLQQDLDEERVAGAFRPEVRVGIHAGEAIHDSDGDLVGKVVNLTSRVVDVAGDGEILVTEPVADHLPPGREVREGGLHELKGHSRPRHLLRVVWRSEEDVIVLDQPDQQSS